MVCGDGICDTHVEPRRRGVSNGFGECSAAAFVRSEVVADSCTNASDDCRVARVYKGIRSKVWAFLNDS